MITNQQRLRATLVMYCFSLAILPDASFAVPFQVNDEETQLATRLAVRDIAEPPFQYALEAGYREDNLRWSIANGGGVNVASEVSWKKTVIAQLRATGKVNPGGNWLLRGIFATGAVKSGSNQDSDYAGSDRTQEYSRSDNKTGGAVRDLSIGVGKKFRLIDFSAGGMVQAVPLAGLSIHQQSLTMYDGFQAIPASGPISGLQSSYDSQWKGSWLGMDALVELGGRISLTATLEYHWADYTAEANWNLRSDLAHPVSFKHIANGYGTLVSLGTIYRFSRNFLMNASLERQKWATYSGYDQTNFSFGGTNYYTLNPVNWDSTAFSFGATYEF